MRNNKNYIPPKVRKIVLNRDMYQCQKCGETRSLQIHHINPVYKNGYSRSVDNLITLCKICHSFAPDDINDFNVYKSTGCNPLMDNIDGFIFHINNLSDYFNNVLEMAKKNHIERVTMGRMEAIKNGKKMGRPENKIPVDEIKRLLAEGLSKTAIARKFGVHRTTIYDKLK